MPKQIKLPAGERTKVVRLVVIDKISNTSNLVRWDPCRIVQVGRKNVESSTPRIPVGQTGKVAIQQLRLKLFF